MAAAETLKYSERLGVIRPGQLERVCERFDLGLLERAAPATAGLWGQIILLTTTTGEFVLRGNPTSPHQLHKERAVAAALHGRSALGVPWPYVVDDDTDLFGWTYAVMPRLPGTPGNVLWSSADDRARVCRARAHGDALGRLHEVAFPAPGPYDPDQDRFVAAGDFRVWTLDRLKSLRSLCRSADALLSDDERFIDALLESSVGALDEPLTPVLVHHDFSLANTIYAGAGGDHEATGVLDLGEAHIGDGDEDLIRFLFRRKAAQRRAFVAAYRRRSPARPGAGDRLAIYAVSGPVVHVERQPARDELVRRGHLHRRGHAGHRQRPSGRPGDVTTEHTARREKPAAGRRHSMRSPEIALEITSCWICSVPSKMSMVSRYRPPVAPESMTCGSSDPSPSGSTRVRRVLVLEVVLGRAVNSTVEHGVEPDPRRHPVGANDSQPVRCRDDGYVGHANTVEQSCAARNRRWTSPSACRRSYSRWAEAEETISVCVAEVGGWNALYLDGSGAVRLRAVRWRGRAAVAPCLGRWVRRGGRA